MKLRLEFKLQDCWLGVFWERNPSIFGEWIDVWICLVPMFPIHLWWQRKETIV